MNSLIQAVQLADKYSRLKADGTKETWAEVVQRVIDFLSVELQRQGRTMQEGWTRDIQQAMLRMDVLPSMRVVQMAGPALQRDHVGAYNCFAGGTEYVTRRGIFTFAETVDTVQEVLAADGQWRPALVQQFGEDVVNVITLRPGSRSRTGLRKVVRATANHGWLTTRGPIRDLQVGDEVIANSLQTSFSADEWVRGFLFGDGTVQHNCARVRLCGKKSQHLPLFEQTGARVSYPPSADGDSVVSWPVHVFADCKELPSTPSPSWMQGYMAADGYMCEAQPGLSTTREDVVDYLQLHAAELGIVVTGVNVWTKDSNFGPRLPLYKIGIRPASEVVWRVLSIEPTDERVPVFCVTEPVTHTFTLAHGLTSLNCAYLELDGPSALPELLYIMMQGTGVGFSVEEHIIAKWPAVAKETWGYKNEQGEWKGLDKRKTWIVEDSTDGWVDAYRHGIATWMDARDVDFDYSRIRPAGAPLKTKGGFASGPEPFKELLEFTRTIILEAQGRRLTPFEVHRLATKAGSIVMVGGVRRAAQISLSSPHDHKMRDCKHGQFWLQYPELSMANNSVVIQDRDEIAEEWPFLKASGTGERGLFNPNGPIPERRESKDFGTNPCFAGDTLILTKQGHKPIHDLVGQQTIIWNGDAWQQINTFRITGYNQQLVEFTLHDGSRLKVTPYHRMILEDGSSKLAHDLNLGDRLAIHDAPATHGNHHEEAAYTKGFLVGDGTYVNDRPILWLYAPKTMCASRLLNDVKTLQQQQVKTNGVTEFAFASEPGGSRQRLQGLSTVKSVLFPYVSAWKKCLPPEWGTWTYASKCEFLAGLFDADGTAMDTAHGFGYQLSSVHEQLLLDVQAMLKTIGVQSTVRLTKPAQSKDWGHRGGLCQSLPLYRLTISQASAVVFAKNVRCERLTWFGNRTTSYMLKPRWNKIVAINDAGHDTVYCCTVPGMHQLALTQGIMSGQCGEILLRSRQFCNLSIAVARPDDTPETLAEKVRVATLIGTIQSCLTHFPGLPPAWRKNCEEERLLGVDITGTMDCPLLQRTSADTHHLLNTLRLKAQDWNREYAHLLGIKASTSITCNKPSGNSSQLLDCSSGIHPRYSRYYLRRLRIGRDTPLAAHLRGMGVPVYAETGYEDLASSPVWVFEFPAQAPAGAITRRDVSALDQLEYWKMWKTAWTEHNPSCTVYVEDHEWDQVYQWVHANWDIIGGLSFLPKDTHVYPLAPYEEIDAQEYHQRAAAIQWDGQALNAWAGEQAGSTDAACGPGGWCEI